MHWTGKTARSLGLVDAVGGLETAVSLARQHAGLSSDREVDLVVLPAPQGLLEVLTQRDHDAGLGPLPQELQMLARWAELDSAGGVLARLPFDLRIQ